MTSSAPASGFTSAFRALLGVLLLALALLPAARAADPTSTIMDYRLQPLDTIVVDVVGEPALSKLFRITASGEISYPYLGNVKVGDKTTTQVATELKAALEDGYLVNAQVVVQVQDFRKNLVSVFGQVNRPGQVEIPPERRLTLLEVISMASGFTRLAREGDIQVTRAGQSQPIKLDAKELRQNTDPAKVFYVEPGDLIFVPEARI
jgi:polysaccharide export outer membrane protein